jgi:exodeoxyribonuclease V beta subunit
MPAPAPLPVFDCPLDGIHLVEASAGTGKTWNLCGLYLRLLLERGLGVEQVLVVTFTHAATAELRERIRQRLVEVRAHLAGVPPAAGADPFVERLLHALRGRPGCEEARLAQRLELALQSFDQAAISTIHGFCQRALAESAFTAQEPAEAELTWDGMADVHQVVADFWRLHVSAPGTDPALIAHLLASGDSPERWAKLLDKRLARPRAGLLWPAAAKADVPARRAVLETLHAKAQACWQGTRGEIVELLQRGRAALHSRVYGEAALAQAAREWDELLLASAASQALRWKPDKARLLGTAKLASSTLKHKTPPQHTFFALAQQLLDAHAALGTAVADARHALMRSLLEQGPAAVHAERRRRRVLTFDDMLGRLHHKLHDPASGPALAEALRRRFPAALVDEFQDTDPLQLGILETLYGHARQPLFLIGDPKQAIYGFRNADLHTYLQARSRAGHLHTLNANQRSVPGLIHGVNDLFGNHPRAFMLEGLVFHPSEPGTRQRPALSDPEGPGAAWDIRLLPAPSAGAQGLPKAQARQLALSTCVNEIVRLLQHAQEGRVRLGERALRAGDIAVLVRTRAEGSLVRQALQGCGVGSVESRQQSIFTTPDAQDLSRLLQAVAEPTQVRALRTAWATELVGLDASQIEGLSGDEQALAQWVERLAACRQLWLERGVGVMLRQWMADAGVASRLLARADGERRLTNLLHLLETLQAASAEHASPAALLRWFALQRREGAAEDALQLRLESDANLVQIQTIHGAKGLEYPVVVCPFLWDGSLIEPPNDLGCRSYHDAAGSAVLDFGEPDAEVKARILLEKAAERLRLLYVALTRAVHRCVLVAGGYLAASGGNLSPKESGRSLLNWLVAGGPCTPEAWLESGVELEQVDAAWLALGGRLAGAARVSRLADAAPRRLVPAAPPAQALAARRPPSPLPRAMRLASYSQIVKLAGADAAEADHDERALRRARAQGPSGPDDPHDILGFPASAEAGQCIHTLFESVEFGEPAGWHAAIERTLARFGHIAASPPPPAMLHRMLEEVLHTPLPVGTARPLLLADVPAARRLPELAFHFPTPAVPVARLGESLARAGYTELASLTGGTLGRYLTGAIDLVFEHEGRYFIADWKSNLLGHTPQAYAADAVAAEMAAERYRLQYLLYLVALHRHLRRCLPGYSPDEHLGGALYLFVRGVRRNWVDGQGRPTGVHFDRPAPALIEELSALLQRPDANGEARA